MTIELFVGPLPKGWRTSVPGHCWTEQYIDKSGKVNYTGKMSYTYSSWMHMVTRIHGPKSRLESAKKSYLREGIQICSRWIIGDGTKCGFLCFLEDMGERPIGTSLGRHGDMGNYVVGNCSWQTKKQQGQARTYKSRARKNHVR